MPPAPRVLLDGLRFPEGPRWHEERLWFSDMHAGVVLAVDLAGRVETIVAVPGEPSGLGWLPDGRLLVVSMRDRRLLRLEASGLVEHADLSPFATFHCNDMLVDAQGRAYVGNFGFDLHGKAPVAPANLVLVHPDGRAELAATELLFPNGTVLTPDGRTLIVGESFAARLTAFDVAPDGRLAGRRVWASLPASPSGRTAVPDGICLDAEGAVWVASPTSNEFLRVREGGAVAARIPVDRSAIACMLGGPERRTLFLCTSRAHDPAETAAREARIETIEVDVPGAGWP
jgi:sugar lactone lactonase YvrE